VQQSAVGKNWTDHDGVAQMDTDGWVTVGGGKVGPQTLEEVAVGAKQQERNKEGGCQVAVRWSGR